MNEPTQLLLARPIIRSMQTIQGWLSDEEAELLIAATELALRVLPEPHVIVEVGSYCGRSTVVLASSAKALSGQARVYAIDPHGGEVGAADTGVQRTSPTFERFSENLAGAGVADVVEPIRRCSFETEWNRPISLLLVDGLHDYGNVARDFRHFESWLVDGALIAFHDYADYYPGVVAFVDELLRDSPYERMHLAASMMLIRRPSQPIAREVLGAQDAEPLALLTASGAGNHRG